MKTIAFALLALLLPISADAGKGMVVIRNSTAEMSAASRNGFDRLNAAFKGALGMDIDIVPQSSMKPGWAQNCFRVLPGGATVQYDYMIVEGHRQAIGNCGGACPALDSLQKGAFWPAKPTALFSDPTIPSTIIWDNGGPLDSTGIDGNPAPTGFTAYQTVTEYSHANPLRGWHSYGSNPRFTLDPARVPPGVLRVILRITSNPWYEYAKQGLAVADWDSLTAQAADSVTVVVRYRATASGAGTGSPLVECGLGKEDTGDHLNSMLRRALVVAAILDSATGGGVLFQTRPGPITFTPHVVAIGATGTPRTGSSMGAAASSGVFGHVGAFIPNGIDSSLVTIRSSLQSFQSRGIKGSAGVQLNPDSTGPGAPYRSHLEAIRDDWPLAKVFPFELSGLGWVKISTTDSTRSAGGINDQTRNYDAWGAQRLRSLLPPGETDPRDGINCETSGPNGGPDTLSIVCNLLRLKRAAEREFGAERVDNVWAAPLDDFTPLYFGRQAGSMDSLVWILSQFVGLKGLKVGNMALLNLATQSDVDGNQRRGVPRGWSRNLQVWPVIDPATRRRLGDFVFMPSRDTEASCHIILQTGAAHDNPGEFLMGLLIGDWYYASRSPVYFNFHDFFNRTVIFDVTTSWLAGQGDPRNNWRPGYWFLTDFQEWINTVNELAGRTVIQMSYGEDTADWILRSGLR